MPLVRRSVAAPPPNVVQRAMRRSFLEQSLVDAGASRRETPRPVPLYAVRSQAAVAPGSKVRSLALGRSARGQSHRAGSRRSPCTKLFASSRELGDVVFGMPSQRNRGAACPGKRVSLPTRSADRVARAYGRCNRFEIPLVSRELRRYELLLGGTFAHLLDDRADQSHRRLAERCVLRSHRARAVHYGL
jgi:hypothetical protein